jgi:hypothetical protein
MKAFVTARRLDVSISSRGLSVFKLKDIASALLLVTNCCSPLVPMVWVPSAQADHAGKMHITVRIFAYIALCLWMSCCTGSAVQPLEAYQVPWTAKINGEHELQSRIQCYQGIVV